MVKVPDTDRTRGSFARGAGVFVLGATNTDAVKMAPLTGVCLFVVGVAITLVNAKSRRVRAAAVWIAIVTLLVAYAVVAGIAFKSFPSADTAGSSSMGLASAIGIAVLSLAVMVVGREAGPLAALVGSDRITRTARRALAWAFGIPIALALLELAGQDADLVGRDFGEAIVVTVTSALLAFGVVVNAGSMKKAAAITGAARADERFLLQLGDALRASDTAESAIHAVVTRLGAHLDASRCHLSEVDPSGAFVTIHDDYHAGVASMGGRVVVAGSTTANVDAMRRGETVVYADTRADPRTADRFAVFYGPNQLVAFIGVPLMRDGAWCGTLVVGQAVPRTWAPREVALVQAVAERAWVWLEHVRMVEQLKAHEAELRVLNDSLEARVEERTRELTGAQDRIGKSLREKEVLLKEIHHRVKNNLQVVASLLSLQAQRLKDPIARTMLTESQTRVYTIALIHEKLYRSEDLAHVAFEPFARALLSSLFANAGADLRGIRAVLKIETVTLSVDIAMPVSLIITELVSNALKHAFPPERAPEGGRVEVSLRTVAEGEVELSVSDDGVGMPEGFDPRQTLSLGLDLVFTFAEQLSATVDFGPSLGGGHDGRDGVLRPGTRFVLRFRKDR